LLNSLRKVMIRKFLKHDISCLIILYLIFLVIAIQFFGWIIDDLYIYFRYVNNFVHGSGIVYNPGEYVEGFSSFSWLMILSVFGFSGMPLELSAKLISLFLVLVNLILIYKISIKQGLGKLSFLVCLLMLFNLPFILWSVSGFEGMFYMFLLLTAFYKIINFGTGTRDLLIISILIFLIAVSRPEGALMSIAYVVFIYAFHKNKIFSIKAAVLSGLMFSSFLIFRVIYFGDLLPNTYYAKIGHDILGYYEIRSYKNGLFYIIEFFKHNLQFIPLIILIPFTIKELISRKLFLFILTIILVQFFFTIFSGGDWMVQYRFIIPVIPFLSLATVLCLDEFIQLNKLKTPVTYIFFITFLLLMTNSIIAEDKFVIQKETIMWNKLKEYSNEIKNSISAGSLVANGSSGIIPYYLDDVVFLDIVGLTNKTIAKNGLRHGSWFEKSLPEYVYSKNPDWLIMWKKKK